MVLVSFSIPAEALPTYTYKVEAGDVLTVDIAIRGSLSDLSKLSTGLPLEIVGESVYSHHVVTVTPDGYLFLPSLPALPVRGRTLGDIEKNVITMLHFPANGNLVSVALVRTNSMAIHIWGEVKQPGRFLLDHPTTLMEALAYAGGPTEHARLTKILLLHAQDHSWQRIDLSEKHLRREGSPAIVLSPSDTIIVPRSLSVSEFFIFAALSAISTGSAVYVASKAH